MSRFGTIVSLGSSFAAGPGIPPVIDADASRSGANYAHLVAAHYGAHLVDLTVSGATTATILDEPQTTWTGATFPPQIEGMPEDADLVTVTAGGNDLGFIGPMMFAAIRRVWPDSPMLAMGDDPPEPRVPTDAEIDAAATGLARIATEVRRRAPRARIVLVDYLTVLDEDPWGTEDWFSEEEYRMFLATQSALARAHEIAAQRSGAELVKASAVSVGHGVMADDPWVGPPATDLAGLGGTFHPNARGMEAVAAALIQHLEATSL